MNIPDMFDLYVIHVSSRMKDMPPKKGKKKKIEEEKEELSIYDDESRDTW